MIASGYAGTKFGTHVLERLPEASFRRLFKWVLTIIALDMLRRGLTAQFVGMISQTETAGHWFGERIFV